MNDLFANTQRTSRQCQCCEIFLQKPLSEAAEEFVEFVGGVEIAFEFAGREEVECRGKNFLIGEHDVAPSCIRTAGEAQRITQARAGEGDGQAVLVEAVVEKTSQRNRGELRKMGG